MRKRRSFSGLAADYCHHDFLVREIDARMQERLDFIRISPGRILDLGCSCGGSLPGLTQRYPAARRIGLDRAPEMLKQIRDADALVADAAALPLAEASVDLIWSNLLLHWLAKPALALCETQRVLASGGLFMFSTLGPDTLKELRAAMPDHFEHTQKFADLHDWGDQLLSCGFTDPVVDREDITLHYDSFAALMAELRSGSASCNAENRRRGLAGTSFWRQVESAYARQEGKWPASFEVIYGHAWKMPTPARANESPLRFYR